MLSGKSLINNSTDQINKDMNNLQNKNDEEGKKEEDIN
jgi:hypothetical protein